MLSLAKPLAFFLALLLVNFTLVGCDGGEDDPVVDDVILIGTNVPDDFVATGVFSLTATPLDEENNGILDEGVVAAVTIDQVNGDPVSVVVAQSTLGTVNTPSGNPLAVAINLDASSSMRTTDPLRTRVDGALEFVKTLEESGVNYEASVSDYGSGRTEPFRATRLLQDYSSDSTALNAAIRLVGASGSTPTYESLIELMTYSEGERPTASYERGVVLLSDGSPGDGNRRPEACALAVSLDSPVYAIGLGPASDLSPNPTTGATGEMRAIAECSGGTYAGIIPGDVSSVRNIFSNIATANAEGSVEVEVRLSDFENVIGIGDRVEGTLTLSFGGGEASASFGFTVPGPSRPAPTGFQGITD